MNWRVRTDPCGTLRGADDLLDGRVPDLLGHLLEQVVHRVRHLVDEGRDDRVDDLLVDRGVRLEAEAPPELLDVPVERGEVGHQLVVGDDQPERSARRRPRPGRQVREEVLVVGLLTLRPFDRRLEALELELEGAETSLGLDDAPVLLGLESFRGPAPLGLALAHLVLEA